MAPPDKVVPRMEKGADTNADVALDGGTLSIVVVRIHHPQSTDDARGYLCRRIHRHEHIPFYAGFILSFVGGPGNRLCRTSAQPKNQIPLMGSCGGPA